MSLCVRYSETTVVLLSIEVLFLGDRGAHTSIWRVKLPQMTEVATSSQRLTAMTVIWFLQALQKRDLASDPRGEKQVVALLSIPLETHDIVTVLGLENYPSVMSLLSPTTCRQMAVTIVKSILDAGTLVSSEAKVELLFSFIAPLVKDIPGALDDTDDEVRTVACQAITVVW